MDANNSMVNKQNSSINDSASNSQTFSKKENSMLNSHQKTKTKTKHLQFALLCKNNPNIKYELNTEELSMHIISCDDCLKELLLYQARQKKLEKEILNNQKSENNHNKKNKKNKKYDINNSMSIKPEDLNNISDDEDGSQSDSENDDEDNILGNTMFNVDKMKQYGRKKEKRNNKRNNSMEKDNESWGGEENEGKDENDNDLLAQTMLNVNDVEKKVKKKSNKNKKNKDKDKEKISESEGEENSNDENDFEDLFINGKKKKKIEDDKNGKTKKKDEDDDDDDEELNV